MKVLTIVCTLGLLSAVRADLPTVDVADFQELNFTNMIDHYNYQDSRTYSQRYWVNDKYFNQTDPSNPNFLYICGEYRCSVPDTRLFPFMVGASHNARLFVLEHRFYGDSQPFDDWSAQSLRYLSSEQAMSDLAYFLGQMNLDNPARQTIVIGGSYPGALSAWFRSRYPHLAVAAWSSSGVVQPIEDFWKFDNQVYTSSLLSGDYCPQMIKTSNDWITGQGLLRNEAAGNTIIEQFLAGTPSAGMRTDDFMFYYADIQVEGIQYGHRTQMCDMLKTAMDNGYTQEQIFYNMTDFGTNVAGVNPPDYDTRALQNETINPYSSGRSWTYQYCTEYGWFQVPSETNPMRSAMLDHPYWPKMCERVYGFNMTALSLPKVNATTYDQGGFDSNLTFASAGTNIFFTNGVEDPWQWATVRSNNTDLSQIARTSDCTDCGHCVELYTPASTDSAELNQTRDMIVTWIAGILATEFPPTKEFLQ